MVNVQVGVFPGRVDNYVVEVGTTVAQALEMAGLSQNNEQDIKVDSEVVSADYCITEDTGMILLAKRIKGAVL